MDLFDDGLDFMLLPTSRQDADIAIAGIVRNIGFILSREDVPIAARDEIVASLTRSLGALQMQRAYLPSVLVH